MCLIFSGQGIIEIDISRLMTYAQQIEKEKIKEKERKTKRSRIGNFNHP